MLGTQFAIRTTLVAGIVVATVGSLTACLPPGPMTEPSSSPTESMEPTPTVSASPTASPSATAPPTDSVPLSIPCADVVDAQTIYDFNPNFVLLNSFSPASDTLAAQAIQNQGTACRWINQTSNITIDIGLSNPGAVALSAAKKTASAGTALSGFGDAAFFTRSGGLGTVQVFSGKFWISAASPAFSTAEDANPLIERAIASTR